MDAAFGRYTLADPAGYRAFLTAHARIVPALEAWLDAHQPETLKGWQAVRRGPALLADLAALDVPPPPTAEINLDSDIASVCGATYVLEGSRMGGALLARSVAPQLPRAYLGYPTQVALWRAFATELDRLLPDEAATARAGTAALAVFNLFRAATA